MIHSKIITSNNSTELEHLLEQYIRDKQIIIRNIITISYSHSKQVLKTFNGNIEEQATSYSVLLVYTDDGTSW